MTIRCTRAQGEAVAAMDDLPGFGDEPPVLVADEPDETKPDEWLIHAYFEHEPTREELPARQPWERQAPASSSLARRTG